MFQPSIQRGPCCPTSSILGCPPRLLLVLALFLLPLLGSTAGAQQTLSEGAFRAIVNRQIQAWQTHDFRVAAVDWAPDGELTSPGGSFGLSQLQPTITDYFKHFRDLKVTVTRTFLSADGKQGAIEWDWDVTRIRDGKRGLTSDAILVTFERGKIKSWREYFNLAASVDAAP